MSSDLSGITVSTLLPSHPLASAEAAAAAASKKPTFEPKPGYKKWRKHKGVRIRIGRINSPSGNGTDGDGEEEEYDDAFEGEEEVREAAFHLIAFPDGSPAPGSPQFPLQRTLSATSSAGGGSGGDGSSSSVTDGHAAVAVPRAFKEYKVAVKKLLKEYLLEEDLDAALNEVHLLGAVNYSHEFVRRALIMGVEASDSKREHISRLLSNVYGVDVPMYKMGK